MSIFNTRLAACSVHGVTYVADGECPTCVRQGLTVYVIEVIAADGSSWRRRVAARTEEQALATVPEPELAVAIEEEEV